VVDWLTNVHEQLMLACVVSWTITIGIMTSLTAACYKGHADIVSDTVTVCDTSYCQYTVWCVQ
jgi:hypothetical protein